ncbi:MAG: hypothetical protein IPK67_18695 [Planctomycetes bacterium]|nr:hypothetical protein [Planctomycetota bacterium]
MEGLVLVFQRVLQEGPEGKRPLDVQKEQVQGIGTGLELACFLASMRGAACVIDERLELAIPEAQRGPGNGVLLAYFDPRTGERELRGSPLLFFRAGAAHAALESWAEDTRMEAMLRRVLPQQLTRALRGLASLGKPPKPGVVQAAPGQVRQLLKLDPKKGGRS